MSNIFSKDEMEEIVRRIEESYNVAGKQVKMTIEIIDEVNKKETKDTREDDVRKAVEDLVEQMKDSHVMSHYLLSESIKDYYKSIYTIKYNIATIRRKVLLSTEISLENIDVEKCNDGNYKATISYRKCNHYNDTVRKIYMLLGDDNKIIDISELYF